MPPLTELWKIGLRGYKDFAPTALATLASNQWLIFSKSAIGNRKLK